MVSSTSSSFPSLPFFFVCYVQIEGLKVLKSKDSGIELRMSVEEIVEGCIEE